MVDATAAIRETKLIEEEVECRPEKTSSDLDENVDVCLVCHCMDGGSTICRECSVCCMIVGSL